MLFCVDRAGLVGSDGETHQGIFDLSYLTSIPNMSVMAPKNLWELKDMIAFGAAYDGPLAIRYPRGEAYRGFKEFRAPIVYGKSETLCEEDEIAILAIGSMVSTGDHVRNKLKAQGHGCSLVNLRFAKPIDTEVLDRMAEKHRYIVTMEENVLQGGVGLAIADYVRGRYPGVRLMHIALPDAYVEHGNVSLLREELGIDSGSILKKINREFFGEENG